MKVAAIIPAAGLGTRMGRSAASGSSPERGASEKPLQGGGPPPPNGRRLAENRKRSNLFPGESGTSRKQFMLLEGVPIVVHTLRKFLVSPAISEVVVALREEDRDWFADQLRVENPQKPVQLVIGGEHRQQSVQNGLAAASPDAELVAVHDAVRPFVSVELIGRVIAAAAETGAAILAMPPVDTVKQVHRTIIRSTLPREQIVLAQTPQVFRTELLRRAYEQAAKDGFIGTDEASLVEHLDVDVTVVLGSDRNIKITRQSDMALARLFLREELAPAR